MFFKMNVLMTENQAIRFIRTQLGLDQLSFAEALNMKQGSISDIERGKAPVSKKFINKLSSILYIDQNFIAGKSEDIFLKPHSLESVKKQILSIQENTLQEVDKLKTELVHKKEIMEAKNEIIALLKEENQRLKAYLEEVQTRLRNFGQSV